MGKMSDFYSDSSQYGDKTLKNTEGAHNSSKPIGQKESPPMKYMEDPEDYKTRSMKPKDQAGD